MKSILVSLLPLLLASAGNLAAVTRKKPNIIFIFANDSGWGPFRGTGIRL